MKKFVLLLSLSCVSYFAFSQCHGQNCYEKSANRVNNGDFENDSAGILSDYQYTTTSSGGVGGYYGIFTDASKLTTAYYCPRDHTTGSGHMMCFDGFLDGTRLAWGQTLRGLDTGTLYYINYWVTDLGGGKDPATTQLKINGTFVTGRDTIITVVGSWEKRSLTWKSGSADTAELRLIQYCSGNSGNNFALDDIEFYSCDTILDPPPLELGPDKEICKGTNLTLNATLKFDSYLWDNNTKLFVRNVNQTGTYWVRTTYQGCVLSDTISVTVDSSLVVALGNDITVCDQPVVLDAGITGVTYAWNTGATTKTITADTSGTYTVTVTNAKNCKDRSSVEVRIGTPFTIDLGPDRELCRGDRVTLGTGDTTREYQWNTGDTTGLITVQDGNMYILMASLDGCEDEDSVLVTIHDLPEVNLGNDTAVCQGELVMLDAGPGNRRYGWNNADTNRMVTVGAAGMYHVMVTDENGCISFDTIRLNINALPDINVRIDGNTVICDDDSTVLEVTTAGLVSYAWSKDGSGIPGGNASYLGIYNTGRYRVEATDTNGCTNVSDSIAIRVNPTPVITAHPVDLSAKEDNPALFTVGSDGNAYTYQWQENRGTGWVNLPEGSVYKNVRTDSLTVVRARAGMDGYQYRCELETDSGCLAHTNPANLAIILGVNNAALPASIKVYPNPSDGKLVIQSSALIIDEVQLIALDGRTIDRKALAPSTQSEVTFDGVKPGCYILLLKSSDNDLFRLNWMVQ